MVPKRVEQTTAVTFDARWKPKRREVTRLIERGTPAFLPFSDAELLELRRVIDPAVGACHDRNT